MSMNMKVESMLSYHTFEVPTAIKHGIGAIKHIGEEIKAFGSDKVLLVTDPGIHNAGVTKPYRPGAQLRASVKKWFNHFGTFSPKAS